MSARKDPRTGHWFYRKWVQAPTGRQRIFGAVDAVGQPFRRKIDAEAAEREAIETLSKPPRPPMPTFADWFHGRFWSEWVLGGPRGANKASEQQSKRSIFDYHLKDFFGPLPLDKIDLALINTFRAQLRAKNVTEKRLNNILSVLSKPLNYAATVRVIDRAPTVGISKVDHSTNRSRQSLPATTACASARCGRCACSTWT
jgi:hypothetical protein